MRSMQFNQNLFLKYLSITDFLENNNILSFKFIYLTFIYLTEYLRIVTHNKTMVTNNEGTEY